MTDVTVATFAIGADAAARVRQQLDRSCAYMSPRSCRPQGNTFKKMADSFAQLLADSPEAFDTSSQPMTGKQLRVIWHLRQKSAGILYVVQANQLQTINLVLSGVDPKADVLAIEEVGHALSPLDAYFESLAIVRFGARPMLATFCSRIGVLDQTVDTLQMAFASAFFQRLELSAPTPRAHDVQEPLMDSTQFRSTAARSGTSRLSGEVRG
jgi:hypothetical protein